jgi:hypothetical protein
MTGSFAPELAEPLAGLSYRERYASPPPSRMDRPILYGIKQNDRWVVIYSPHDIHCGVSDHNCLDCVGYRPEDAKTIAGNILLYALYGPPKDTQDQPAAEDGRDSHTSEAEPRP